MDFAEKYDRYIEKNDLYRTEGTQGVLNLTKIVNEMGYREMPYQGGDSLNLFLEDNPGAVEAIHAWIRENGSAEWAAEMGLEEEEEEEEV